MNEHTSDHLADPHGSSQRHQGAKSEPIPAEQVDLHRVFFWGTVAWAIVFLFAWGMTLIDARWLGSELKLPWISGVGVIVGIISLAWLRKSRQAGSARARK
ncbi:hypothetical protein [Rarobacter faecitabidus]|uniref:hypothetical protein n=1 Tax=Rarobacter faecitabidus TaxID=13243 RepID=UPI001154D18D|nr:hypothetical protein [Rarobacter faecitabidus]